MLLHQSVAWFLYDLHVVASVAVLHWAVGRPIPGFYRGRSADARMVAGLR